ncbi:hypothetical protein PAXINDRAFT_16841 [Paxillus involutus ATCC 200175]|uniref:Uncharacterized protein n=1 Tax=Paxillus involutus ATCC 200175 TaxID=664439 RepID=A0A0C9THA2_PAXIN|nr:hypothetical protein PAXINDRAFT_16841 [Paxillus involutus ATCC 200175]
MTPFKQYWKISETRTVQVFGEAFSSPTCLDAYQEVNSLPREQGDDLERVVAPLMLWSDATHLANFGDASLCPSISFLATSQNILEGSQQLLPVIMSLTYLPYIYVGFFEEGSSDDVYTHCKWELMQAIWKLLLNKKFMHAYNRLPREFLGKCPCPRCLVKKADIPDMGTESDMKTQEQQARVDGDERRKKILKARNYIFKRGAGINSKCVKGVLYKLPQEHAVRGHRKAALAAKQGQAVPVSQPKCKTLNLTTYKYHALGDYPSTICQYGTTDSYSTQLGELEHRRSKRRFPRSGKKKGGMVWSIANQEAIERFIKKVNDAHEKFSLQNEPAPRCLRNSPSEHYHIAKSSHKSEDLTAWLVEQRGDSAFENFLPQLQDHILGRVRGLAYDSDEHEFSDEDRSSININDNKMYHHSMFRVNYTTYDLRREQDTINPSTHADIMVLSHEDEQTHPYWYAHVVHIFHIMVCSHKNVFSHPHEHALHTMVPA